jgi:ParB/RepB/Spo0J family partition protein
MPKMQNNGKLRQITLNQIILNGNVRTDYTDIEELAASIKAVGLLEPVIVKPLSEDMFELVAGFRRYRAFEYLKEKGDGFTMIDALVVTGDKLTLQLVENLQRSDLTPKDREAGIYQLTQTGVSSKEAAVRLSKNYHFIYRNISAYKVRSYLTQAALTQIKELEADAKRWGESPPPGALDDLEAAKQWLADIDELATAVLCEFSAVKKESLIPMSKRLIAGGGTLACVRQLLRDYNAPKKEASTAQPETPATDDADVNISMDDDGGDPIMDDAIALDAGDAGETLPTVKEITSPAKKTSAPPPARVLESPPHKKVDLNSVQVVIRDYIEKISKGEAGYVFEYKTDAAYEIWSLILAELAGL